MNCQSVSKRFTFKQGNVVHTASLISSLCSSDRSFNGLLALLATLLLPPFGPTPPPLRRRLDAALVPESANVFEMDLLLHRDEAGGLEICLRLRSLLFHVAIGQRIRTEVGCWCLEVGPLVYLRWHIRNEEQRKDVKMRPWCALVPGTLCVSRPSLLVITGIILGAGYVDSVR